MTDTTTPDPPAHLSARGKELWKHIAPRRAKSPERLALLQTALESLDRADEVAQIVTEEGMTSRTKTTGTVHVHPLLKIERESRQLFSKIWGQLSLDSEPYCFEDTLE